VGSKYRRRNLENHKVIANDKAKYDIVSKETPCCLYYSDAPWLNLQRTNKYSIEFLPPPPPEIV
jgi:hypothetical protein